MKRNQTHGKGLRRIGAVCAVVVGVAIAAAAAQAAAPIVGVWMGGGGQIWVSQTGTDWLGRSVYRGVVVVPTTFDCRHPRGEVVWKDIKAVKGTDGEKYTGEHLWYTDDCKPYEYGDGTFTVSGAAGIYQLKACATLQGKSGCSNFYKSTSSSKRKRRK